MMKGIKYEARKNVYPNDMLLYLVGHRLEVLKFLAKKKRRGDKGEKREREGKKSNVSDSLRPQN